jgi:hypothetical protein
MANRNYGGNGSHVLIVAAQAAAQLKIELWRLGRLHRLSANVATGGRRMSGCEGGFAVQKAGLQAIIVTVLSHCA